MDSEIGAARSQTRRVGVPRIVAFLGCPVSPRWVIAAVVVLSVLKLLIVPKFYQLDMPVHDIGFGFGAAAQTVAATGLTKVCPPLFLDAPNLKCTVAERMPLIPYLYAGAMKLVGDNTLRLAILKTAVLDLLLLYFLARWLAIVGADRFTLMLIAMVFAGPQYMLHSFSPHYEEGFLIQLLAVLMVIQLVYVWERENELASWARLPAYIAVNAAIYLAKSSMILVMMWGFIFLARFMRLRTATKVAAVLVMCAPLLLWGAYTKYMTGHFAIGTSIDGWNLFLGNNSATLDFYPRYTVDILHGDSPIELDGRTLNRINLRDFDRQLEKQGPADEWQIDDGYRSLAIVWATGHIGEELRLVARRLITFFFEIRNNPVAPGHDKPPALALLAGMAWMTVMRVIMWSAIITAGLAIWRGSNMRSAGLCFLCFLAAYTAPCIVAYAYERHVVPIILPATLFLASAWRARVSSAVWK